VFLGVPDHGIQKCELAVRQHMTLSGRLIELGNKTAFEMQRSFIFVRKSVGMWETW
jgi:hypothetical protein